MENLEYIKIKRIIGYYLYGQDTIGVEMHNPPIKKDLVKAIKHKEYLNRIDFSEFKKEVIKKIDRKIEEIQKTITSDVAQAIKEIKNENNLC